MCYISALLSYKYYNSFICRNSPPVFIWYSYLKNFFLKIAKPHDTEAMLYREPLSNYRGIIAPFT